MNGSDDSARERLKQRLQPTHDCIPIEQFEGPLSDDDRAHLAMCTRCQAEFALWRAVTEPGTRTDNESARRVAGELDRKLGWTSPTHGAAHTKWRSGLHRWSFAAAAVLVALTAGYVAWDPEPRVDEAAAGGEGYRSASIRVVSPVGEIDRPPDELAWVAVQGDVRYDVRVLEVDGTLLWTTTSSSPSVDLLPSLRADFVPGKTIMWDVTARNSAGVAVAYSGAQQFRVRVPSAPRRQ